MALSNYVKDFTRGSIRLSDGTGTPLFILLDLDQGDLTFGPLQDELNEVVPYQRRGKLSGIGRGERIFPSGSFTVQVAQFTDASAKVISDFILRNGAFSAAVSTRGSGQVFTIDLRFVMEGTDHGDSADHTVTLEDCYCQIASFDEGAPNTISVNFVCYGAITGDLSCAEIA